jgi:NAD(P)-dependent dehydrogenase (short-subunit alcohol dehydrogenase family)
MAYLNAPNMQAVTQSAVKRVGYPEDIASLVSFLASKGSSFITGLSNLVFSWMARI